MKILLKLYKLLILVGFICTALIGCQSNSSPNQLKVGTIAGPDTQLLEVAKEVAKQKYGLDIQIVEFTDYAMPNTALNDGSIDANMFQHIPYLEETKKNRGYDLMVIGKTFIFPMGLYSEKFSSLDQVADNTLVAIPNDPTNERRALLLLQQAGLIQLNPIPNSEVTLAFIKNNPKNLIIKPMNAAQLPRVLPDVGLAAINNNYAIPAGLDPKNALIVEGSESVYANVVAIRTQDKNDPRFLQLIEALHSPEVIKAAKQIFNNQAIPAWKNSQKFSSLNK